ncbi:uncharacterized protein LOC136084989 [Hydra vulgaris]|uniref:Uncharacterized protein LOC136084989 n=1 Tax=Hydra vulgaris TaxID=6087 RepID=A0ABM4CKZ1_HYDVU
MIFEILLVYNVVFSVSFNPESYITCKNEDKFTTLSGDLHCTLSCECPSDEQKEVRNVYVGCEKCCCANINYKHIEKALQETTKNLTYALLKNRNLTDYNENLKKKSEAAVNQFKKKISALIVAICVLSFFFFVIIGILIYFPLLKKWLKQLISQCFRSSKVTTDCEGRRESKLITVENVAFL